MVAVQIHVGVLARAHTPIDAHKAQPGSIWDVAMLRCMHNLTAPTNVTAMLNVQALGEVPMMGAHTPCALSQPGGRSGYGDSLIDACIC